MARRGVGLFGRDELGVWLCERRLGIVECGGEVALQPAEEALRLVIRAVRAAGVVPLRDGPRRAQARRREAASEVRVRRAGVRGVQDEQQQQSRAQAPAPRRTRDSGPQTQLVGTFSELKCE